MFCTCSVRCLGQLFPPHTHLLSRPGSILSPQQCTGPSTPGHHCTSSRPSPSWSFPPSLVHIPWLPMAFPGHPHRSSCPLGSSPTNSLTPPEQENPKAGRRAELVLNPFLLTLCHRISKLKNVGIQRSCHPPPDFLYRGTKAWREREDNRTWT